MSKTKPKNPTEIELPINEDGEICPPDIDEAIEAILFAAGHAVTYEQLGKLFEIPMLEMKARVLEYADKYNHQPLSRGVILLTYDEACQLCTKPNYLPYIRLALGIRRNGNLSASSIETLAIVAYNQPVTRAYIDEVRKVDSSYAVGNLLERGLIESKGRLDAPGRPTLLGTTPDFLRCFGLSSLTDLPDIHSEDGMQMLQRIGQQLSMEDMDQLSITVPEKTVPEEELLPEAVQLDIAEQIPAEGDAE